MELAEIVEELDELGHGREGQDDAFELLIVKLGQASRHLMDIKHTDTEDLNPRDQAQLQHIYRDMCAGLLLATIELMHEKGVDPDAAVEERLGIMRDFQEHTEQEPADGGVDTLDPEDDRSVY